MIPDPRQDIIMRIREWPFKYRPQEKQKLFHDAREMYRYRALFGGTGSGKTLGGIAECLRWLHDYPGIVGYVYEPTYIMVRRILLPTLEDECLLGKPLEHHPFVKEYLKGDKKIEFINGSTLWFGSLEDPEMSEGPNVDFIMCDEYRLVRDADTAWKTLRRRLRGSVPGKYPNGAWVTTTPDDPTPWDDKSRTGSVLYSFFEDPRTKNSKSNLYRMSIYDNKMLGEAFIRDIEEAHTGAWAERFIHGRFAEIGLGSLPFDSTVHVLSGDLLSMVTSKGFGWKRWAYGVDFGWTDPHVTVSIGFDGDNRAYIMDEFYKSRASDEEILGVARNMWNQSGEGVFYCDPTEPRTIDKMRGSGLQAVGNTSKREEGIRELGSRLNVAGDGRPRLYIHPRCVNTISEFQTYDESKKTRDHTVDAVRYALMGGFTQDVSRPTPRAGRYKSGKRKDLW